MTFTVRRIIEVVDFVKKREGLRRDYQAKALAKREKTRVTYKVLTPKGQGG